VRYGNGFGRSTAAGRCLAGAVILVLAATTACGGGDGGGDTADDGRAPSNAESNESAASTGGPTPEALPAGSSAFYDVAEPLPAGEPGDLLRHQPVDLMVEGADVSRIMYLSESVAGEPVAVTGLVVVPRQPPPASGWRLLTHGHGSTGLADACAPSVDDQYALELSVLAHIAAPAGFVVVSTDYEGLGTPGRHPFLVGESEGRSMLDAARAARQLLGDDLGPDTAIAGYSQGGHAALWAHQLASDWAPELEIVGTVVGAPASEVVSLVRRSVALPPPGQAISVAAVAGLAAVEPAAGAGAGADPDADPAAVLSTPGLALVDVLDEQCFGQVPDGPSLFRADPTAVEPWRTLLAEAQPGSTAARAPVLVVHSAEDANVPVDDSAALLARQCDAGQVVERRVLPTGDHVVSAVPTYTQGVEWLVGLAAGVPPGSSCGG
jgi:hypothetical protein